MATFPFADTLVTTMLADINAQTAKDMKEARSNISINVATVRDYLFGELSLFELKGVTLKVP